MKSSYDPEYAASTSKSPNTTTLYHAAHSNRRRRGPADDYGERSEKSSDDDSSNSDSDSDSDAGSEKGEEGNGKGKNHLLLYGAIVIGVILLCIGGYFVIRSVTSSAAAAQPAGSSTSAASGGGSGGTASGAGSSVGGGTGASGGPSSSVLDVVPSYAEETGPIVATDAPTSSASSSAFSSSKTASKTSHSRPASPSLSSAQQSTQKPTSAPSSSSSSRSASPPQSTTSSSAGNSGACTPTDGATCAQQADALKYHNDVRATHHAAALTWNATLAGTSLTWGKGCVFEHSGGKLLPGGYGENLWMSSVWSSTGKIEQNKSMKDMTESWTNEEKDYDYSNPGFSEAAGHFTQVVWKDTVSVGCAIVECNTDKDWTIGVCQYHPAGNVIGSFDTEVLKP